MAYYVTFKTDNEEEKVGIAFPDQRTVVDLERAENFMFNDTSIIPKNMLDIIKADDKVKSRIKKIENEASTSGNTVPVYNESDINLLAPIPRTPKNVIAIGLNYKKHNEEFTGNNKTSQYPIVFSKAPTSIVGPECKVNSYPQYTESIDYEGELGVVIGKKGKDIAKEKAQDYIFGYTIINDISVRDRQKRTSQWFLGKSMDTHCPMGPYIIEEENVDWPVKLDLITKVNSEIRQKSNTNLLLFDIPTIISTVSEGLTLEPGDVIATGTCEGVGLGFDPPKYLKKGDIVEVEIEKLGTLKNPIV
jgi:2-keto-4-pentenoate hydratase/2-oxohepta-3-ene-1,7-dioic acid hydratase in catechol pathway